MRQLGPAGGRPGGADALRYVSLLVQSLALLWVVLLVCTQVRWACPSVEPWITGPLSAEADWLVESMLYLLCRWR